MAILAAGRGARLGGERPKPLADIGGETMLGRLCRLVAEGGREPVPILGHRSAEVIAALRPAHWLANEAWATTNTAASLSIAAEAWPEGDLLWVNGDVVCDAEALERVFAAEGSAAAVDRKRTGEEEVGYLLGPGGSIRRLAKALAGAAGESLGIHRVAAADRALLEVGLRECGPGDYFESGLEHAVGLGAKVHPVPVDDLLCLEVDFPEDLERARDLLGRVRS